MQSSFFVGHQRNTVGGQEEGIVHLTYFLVGSPLLPPEQKQREKKD